MSKAVRLADIAEKLNVSTVTVPKHYQDKRASAMKCGKKSKSWQESWGISLLQR